MAGGGAAFTGAGSFAGIGSVTAAAGGSVVGPIPDVRGPSPAAGTATTVRGGRPGPSAPVPAGGTGTVPCGTSTPPTAGAAWVSERSASAVAPPAAAITPSTTAARTNGRRCHGVVVIPGPAGVRAKFSSGRTGRWCARCDFCGTTSGRSAACDQASAATSGARSLGLPCTRVTADAPGSGCSCAARSAAPVAAVRPGRAAVMIGTRSCADSVAVTAGTAAVPPTDATATRSPNWMPLRCRHSRSASTTSVNGVRTASSMS